MSHDLQFNVQNADGSFASPQATPLPSNAMNHLPPASNNSNNEPVGTVEYLRNKLAQSSHPSVVIFHLLFKISALMLYMFGKWFTDSDIVVLCGCILLLAADFWVVKNITGRLLVGLRWWNKVENDTTTWIFESAEDKQVNSFDRSVFWFVLYATPLVWIVRVILDLVQLKVEWLLIDAMAVALSGANVYGYYKCSTDQKARFQQMMQQGAQQGAVAMMRSNVLSVLTGQNANNSNTYV